MSKGMISMSALRAWAVIDFAYPMVTIKVKVLVEFL